MHEAHDVLFYPFLLISKQRQMMHHTFHAFQNAPYKDISRGGIFDDFIGVRALL